MRRFWSALAITAAFTLNGMSFAADTAKAGDAPKPTAKAAKPAAAPKPPAPEPTYSGKNPKTMGATAGTPDNTPPAGFVALFNGKDLAGWRGLMERPNDNPIKRNALSPEERAKAQAKADEDAKAHWKAEDGVIVFDGKGRSLATEKQYGNFEMWVSWKIKALGDSGIYLRGSPQVQIWDPTNTKVARSEKGSGALYNNEKNPRDPLVKADNPIEQWNTFYIRMIGDKVTVYLNGQLVTDEVTMENYWDRTQPIFPKEQIELQNHGNTLWFKNIYIKELP